MSKSKGRRAHRQPARTNPLQLPEIAITIQKALVLHQRGQLAQAEALYRDVLKKIPEHFDALHLLGVIEYQRQRYAAAVRLIGRALKADSNSAAAHSNIANALNGLKRYEEALASYDRALAIMPDYAEALSNRGVVLNDFEAS